MNVGVQTFPPTVRDSVCDIRDWPRHERKQSLASRRRLSLFRELLQKCDLEVIEFLIRAGELPPSSVLHLTFDNVPIFVILEDVSRYACGDWGKELALRVAIVAVLHASAALSLVMTLSITSSSAPRPYGFSYAHLHH